MTIAGRKDDHIALALGQRHGRSDFDDVAFVHHALAGIDREDVSLATSVAGLPWRAPLYINAMTGGSERAGTINRDLAIAARENGVPIACGSMSAYFKDRTTAPTFSVIREHNPDGVVIANVNAATAPARARRAVDLVGADALQIHLNTVQETVMPEGDRSFAAWPAGIERIVAAVDVPVIVKEVGFGLSRESVAVLQKAGVAVADVAGRGGTNFAGIENDRRAGKEYAYLEGWGQSAPACLLDAADLGLPLLASGGIRHPLDVLRGLALGAVACGVSGTFLRTLHEGGRDALVAEIASWLDQIVALMTMVGARRPTDLTRRDVLVRGELRAFCVDRGIDTCRLARRSGDVAAAGTAILDGLVERERVEGAS